MWTRSGKLVSAVRLAEPPADGARPHPEATTGHDMSEIRDWIHIAEGVIGKMPTQRNRHIGATGRAPARRVRIRRKRVVNPAAARPGLP
mgnify:CR=1 FL=1